MVVMDTTAARGAPACRAAPPSGEVTLRSAGESLIVSSKTPTPGKEKERKKKFSSFVIPAASAPGEEATDPRQKYTSLTHCFSNLPHHFSQNGGKKASIESTRERVGGVGEGGGSHQQQELSIVYQAPAETSSSPAQDRLTWS